MQWRGGRNSFQDQPLAGGPPVDMLKMGTNYFERHNKSGNYKGKIKVSAI